jgi:signal transduction histidine kinase
VELRVSDSGPGIAPEMREQIFDRFVQLGSERMVSRAGRGLGLSFCRLAVEAHGGRIWVADAAPGTAFHIRLPR